MIHDIGNLHGLFGPPRRVLSAEIWLEGRGVSTVLDYGDERRAVATWVDLPDLWDFKETLEVYGSRERVLASFPTGFRARAAVVCHAARDGRRSDTLAPRVRLARQPIQAGAAALRRVHPQWPATNHAGS